MKKNDTIRNYTSNKNLVSLRLRTKKNLLNFAQKLKNEKKLT